MTKVMIFAAYQRPALWNGMPEWCGLHWFCSLAEPSEGSLVSTAAVLHQLPSERVGVFVSPSLTELQEVIFGGKSGFVIHGNFNEDLLD